jgi:hypothetical protein
MYPAGALVANDPPWLASPHVSPGRVAAVEYVMVPVPEELAPKVLSYINWKDVQSRTASAGPPGAAVDEDPHEPIARAFARLDGDSRALVSVVAAAALDKEDLTIPEAARRAGMTTREALGVLLEVNNVIASEGGPPLPFGGTDKGGPPAGEFTWDTHMVVMSEAVAGPILDLARPSGS